MQRRDRIFLISAGVLAIIGLIMLTVSIINDSNNDLYVTDEVTGREFYKDPEQAEESTELEIVSLLESEEVQKYFYSDYLLQLRAQITDYLHTNVSDEIDIVYVTGRVTYNEERELDFQIKTTDPVDSLHSITARITATDVVVSTITPIE